MALENLKKRYWPTTTLRLEPDVVKKLDYLCEHVSYKRKKASRSQIVTRLIENAARRHEEFIGGLS